MITRFDLWVGKTLFIPGIIRLCQLAHWTQWRFARTANLLFWLGLISSWGSSNKGMGWRVADALMCLAAVVAAAHLCTS